MWPFLMLIVGIPLLIVGADLLVRGASGLALAAKISALVVGLTVVAFGTSAPEIAISVDAAARGFGGVALGNAIGSNIFNVLFVLGLSALASPLAISGQVLRRDTPLMIAASVGVYLMALNGLLSRLDGLILVTGLIAYVAYSLIDGRRVGKARQQEVPALNVPQGARGIAKCTGLLLLGLILLVIGARMLVDGAVQLALYLGVSELVVSLTVVAAGTSLPEAATSVMAAIRKERDIAVGNIVGSNLWNILAVLGIGAVVAPNGIQVPRESIAFDLPVMVGVGVVCLPLFFVGKKLTRIEGAGLFAYYVIYTTYVVLRAVGRESTADVMGKAVVFIVLPLTAVFLLVRVARQLAANRRTENGTDDE
ncbi:calcium/sodium antiporter [Thermostilla marina]